MAKNKMTTIQFEKSIENTFKQALNLVHIKNADYAANDNPFKNFEMVTLMGLTVEEGIAVRLLDKVSRLLNLLHKENKVKDETLIDTLEDIINYSAIMKAHLEQEHYKK